MGWDASTDYYIGRHQNGGTYVSMDGKIDRTAIFDWLLTESELNEIRQNGHDDGGLP